MTPDIMIAWAQAFAYVALSALIGGLVVLAFVGIATALKG